MVTNDLSVRLYKITKFFFACIAFQARQEHLFLLLHNKKAQLKSGTSMFYDNYLMNEYNIQLFNNSPEVTTIIIGINPRQGREIIDFKI